MFDRFDVCEAYYIFATEFHGGQCSEEYAYFERLEMIGFRPSPLLCRESLSENGRRILAKLIRQHRKHEQEV
jgi:hypothetical protein